MKTSNSKRVFSSEMEDEETQKSWFDFAVQKHIAWTLVRAFCNHPAWR